MQKTFVFKVPFSGYSRGYDVFEVSASTEEEALDLIKSGKYWDKLERVETRDDTENEWDGAELTL